MLQTTTWQQAHSLMLHALAQGRTEDAKHYAQIVRAAWYKTL